MEEEGGQVWPSMQVIRLEGAECVLCMQRFRLLMTMLTKKELMHFLGLVGYYQCFCRNFSTVVAPLTDLLKAKAKFVWSSSARRLLRVLKPSSVTLLFWLLLSGRNRLNWK